MTPSDAAFAAARADVNPRAKAALKHKLAAKAEKDAKKKGCRK